MAIQALAASVRLPASLVQQSAVDQASVCGHTDERLLTCPAAVSRTTGKPLWRQRRRIWRMSSMRISSRSVTTGADIAACTGTRSSAFLAVGSEGSHGTHFTCIHITNFFSARGSIIDNQNRKEKKLFLIKPIC